MKEMNGFSFKIVRNRTEQGDRYLKRFTALFAAVGLSSVLLLSGCNNDKVAESKVEEEDKLSIVATIFPQYDFARQIVGDCADVSMLIGAGEESHTYEPTPQDIITIQNADVFIYVGGESESWVDGVLESFDTSNMKIINMMECVDVVEEELVEGMEDAGDDEHFHDNEGENDSNGGVDKTQSGNATADSAEEAEYDEHIWTSVSNAQVITQKIADAVCSADKDNTEIYRSNCEKYLSDLSALKRKINGIVSNAERNTIVFGDRFPLRYFADEFGLDYYAAFPGCAEQSEPSVGTVAFLVDKVREENIPVIFKLELSNGKIADTIAESTKAEVLTFNSCHNMPLQDFLDGVTYLDLMEQNCEALEKALY